MTGPPTLGIDVGGTFLKAVEWDGGRCEILESRRVPDTGVLDSITSICTELVESRRPEAIGVALAGLVEWPEGVFVWGPHVTGVAEPYRRHLEARLRLPVVVDNDANAAAHAEAVAGAAVGVGQGVVLTVGTGIGAGLLVDGRVWRGRSFAGEVGHVTLREDGPRCACGRQGCWETLASGPVLDRAARRLAASVPAERDRSSSAADLVAAAAAGDGRARAEVETVGRWLGRGLVQLVLVLDPEVVVVAGAVSEAGDMLLDAAREEIASRLPGGSHRPAPEVIASRFGRHAGAVGAALLAQSAVGDAAPAPTTSRPE